MQKSEQINELAKALCAAQLEMKHAVKDASNPFFKSDYATLAAISDACLPALNKHGLAITQTTGHFESSNNVSLCTTLIHTSGQWIQSIYPVCPVKNDPQGLGSALSYARRYSLAGIAGVVVGDDDAEDAMNRNAPEKPVKQEKTTPTHPSQAQLKRLFAIAHKHGWSGADVKAYLAQMGLESTKDLNYMQYDSLCEKIEAYPKTPHHPA
jgi:hypothetical protein